jgi:predicted lactoylglutathione lyase
MVKQIFVNLPVKDIDTTKKFFSRLGFTFNEEFTDTNAVCMIIGENMFAMLLLEKFFKTFVKKEIVDAKKSTEVITALEVKSREEVDHMVSKAFSAGGTAANDKYDYGWMYGWSFYDLDGHMWEVFHMDASKRPKNA